ncbi:MAG: extracellular solute-binding protein family 1 [Anaerocolumna sp.]|jgi:ABC-type glycerol-3-phosphate transport system substrate-binding protein|nr:extracellular solute-binding protein family 1 [Anaerocolumna sp.]
MPKRGKLNKIIAIAMLGFMLFDGSFLGTKVAYAKTETTLGDYENVLGTYSVSSEAIDYKDYMNQFDNSRPSEEYVIDAADYSRVDGMEVEAYTDYEGMEGTSIRTGESGLIEYDVNIKTAGFYDISLLYYPIEGKNASIQRSFFVDGKILYNQLALIEFSRIWMNQVDSWEKDNQGNDLKPKQVENPEWITSYLYDSEGYETDELSVYLTAGVHTITMVSLREPMLLRKLVLNNTAEIKEYATIKATQDDAGYQDSTGQMIEIQAENADRKSSQMLYPVQDQSSPSVTPYDAKELRNNSIGGNSWRLVGQWLEWDFDVEQSGYYYITLHAKQNFVKGIYVSRKVTIDGVVPFSEMYDYPFKYEQDWRLDNLSNGEGEQYKFYLEKGSHTLRMQAVLGEFSSIVSDVQGVVTDLNAIYRKVIRITGIAPDAYRDYQIERSIPGLSDELIGVRDRLDDVIKRLRETAGKSSDKEAVLITMRDQLTELSKDVERFTKVLGSYKINMSACGTWITQVIEQPLQLDSIYIYSPDQDVEKVNDSFIDKVVHEFKKLYYSFIINYNQVGNVAESNEESTTITLWVGTGRDQANVIKSLIDETFTKNTNVNVNVMLVDMGTLLQATLAGQGPDVAIQVGNDLPMNYGLRNAVADLSQFGDLSEVKSRFYDSAMVPFEFEGHTYGLPETQTFPMMFYRKDILNELQLKLPKTWDEMKVALSVLTKNQMDLGMLPAEPIYAMFLYQNGGTYYNDGASKSALDSDAAVNAFKEYCELYTDYKLDKETNVLQRFRTGEAPIIVADYTLYNSLQVSAPDIKGLWGFAPVPGVLREDGTIDNTVPSTGQACVMMEASDEKEASWEFMKWWTSAETQTAYGKEMESLMGASARIATANIEAFGNLPWPVADYEALSEQFKTVKGIPQVPGGYFSWRNVNNAFYKVTTEVDTTSPREALMDYVIYINDEINYKRAEFGLPLAEE